MLYRKFGKTNEMVSTLGFGCMRLPLLDGKTFSKIDETKSTQLLHYAIDHGVNYIDTAYPYHGSGMGRGGESEPFVGRALQNGYREKVKLATKLPSWLIQSRADMDKYLNEQLQRLQTDHIDFYLIHALDRTNWPKVRNAGLEDFVQHALQDGRIRLIGFSFHDKLELFKEIVDAYDWSFCQVQYNYLDETFQAGTEGLQYAAQKGLGITIMEPLRGGRLAHPPKEVELRFQQADLHRTPEEWALRWILNHPEVSTILSGMNEMEQVTENISIAGSAEANVFSEKELAVISEAKNIFASKIKVNCTACEYCMPCPNEVNIPSCFSAYNDYHIFGRKDLYSWVRPNQRASNCIECWECESKCPQNISIIEELKNVAALFE
ncbi:MAG TPA: aldo/keto reductase [Bacteroidota bacterium]|nr:aldo/keto reductase [Bacteroidota bacterium]